MRISPLRGLGLARRDTQIYGVDQKWILNVVHSGDPCPLRGIPEMLCRKMK